MRATLSDIVFPAVDVRARHPVPDDIEELAGLMLDAYRETIDSDGSETLEMAEDEVAGFFAGRSGDPLLDHSYVAVRADALTSAVLVSRYEGRPLLAYVFTAPERKGQGLATGLVVRAMTSLSAAGEAELHLWVTAGNEPAEQMYERLGFRDADATERY